MGLAHLVGYHIPINVHRGADVGMAHELLDGNGDADGMEPTPIGRAQRMSPKLGNAGRTRRPLNLLPDMRLADGQAPVTEKAVAVCSGSDCRLFSRR